jgi:hypothetical protein
MEVFWQRFLDPDVIVFLVPIVAIIGGVIIAVVKMLIKHRERVIMIEHGIHPDYPPDDEDKRTG